MIHPTRIRVPGPLREFAPGFGTELLRQGYTLNAARLQIHLMAHLSRWLADEGLEAHHLDSAEVLRFMDARRAAGYVNHRGNRALGPLLGYLRRLGVVQAPLPVRPEGPLATMLERFRHHLTVERGLAKTSVHGYLHAVQPFLEYRMVQGVHGLSLGGLTAADISAFVVARCAQQSRGAAKMTVTALRSLLRFLYLQGVIQQPLAAAVPSVAARQLAGLPKGLSALEVQRLLASCDRRTRVGRRDFAVLTLLVRLGLRIGEVAVLELKDVDWRAGEIVIHGKGKRVDRLPLPADVGEALASYLRRGRWGGAEGRTVFVRIKAPHRALSAGGVAQVVYAAAHRAGMSHVHPHRLRHTTATQLLQAGAPLPEVSQVMRHRLLLTTSIYAKVDQDALRTIARPWPGGGV